MYKHSHESAPLRSRDRPLVFYIVATTVLELLWFLVAEREVIDPFDFAINVAISIPFTAAFLTGFYYFVRYQLEHN